MFRFRFQAELNLPHLIIYSFNCTHLSCASCWDFHKSSRRSGYKTETKASSQLRKHLLFLHDGANNKNVQQKVSSGHLKLSGQSPLNQSAAKPNLKPSR
ncbi:hypothetical protein ILYODFUR_018237 [Ilyodon furcidens]|uniref:Uncharacterized protein n=1 Tax=Ilyodon furcidens TaxID=33524 RepID=A0ABV0TJM6_9TELE